MSPKLAAPQLIGPDVFRSAYLRSVEDVMRFITPERQMTIARHNAGLLPSAHDLGLYLRASVARYDRLVRMVNANLHVERHALQALEVGGFLGAYPLALARLGIATTLVEHYGYYHGALDDLAGYLIASGVRVWDADFTSELSSPPAQHTLVTNMAMLEHLPDSPRQLMDNLRASVASDGLLVLEVPNIAYFHHRRRLLLGRSVHPDLEQVYSSAPPYTGHHREYTASELARLVRLSGMTVREIAMYNYSLSLRRGSVSERLRALVLDLWPTYLFPSTRELIMLAAVPGHEPQLCGSGTSRTEPQALASSDASATL